MHATAEGGVCEIMPDVWRKDMNCYINISWLIFWAFGMNFDKVTLHKQYDTVFLLVSL